MIEARIRTVLAAYPWLVAELDDEIVGYAYATVHNERWAYRWSTDTSVYAAPAHHRRGIGRALYNALLPLLVRQGLYVACAGITLPNPASVALHESFGFRPVGTYDRVGFKHGSWWGSAGGSPSFARSPMARHRASRDRRLAWINGTHPRGGPQPGVRRRSDRRSEPRT